ncbi:MAG: hypothetical protein CM1200mP2_47520 [Planctomycetaceae bacterium]|nr:MAG: hypothetical protein CM1200mP2_47520 [Planctomycetaceae bacterium]
MTNPDSPPRTCSQGHTVPEERDDCPVCGETFAGTESQPGRSLWDVMGQNSTPTQPDTVAPGKPKTTAPLQTRPTVTTPTRHRGRKGCGA